MKFYLFVDNFRGFTDTCIPLTDVNFLVGENSTGKTSVLGLLKMLSNPQFLFDQELSDDDVSFRHFSDMVSAHAPNRTYFRIGFVLEEPKPRTDKEPPTVTGCLVTFVEEEGLPRVAKLTLCRKSETVTIWLKNSTYYYKEWKRAKQASVDEVVSEIRSRWAKEHADKKMRGYRKLVLPPGYSGRVPLFIALSLVSGQAVRVKKIRPVAGLPPTAFPPDLTWLAPIRTKPLRTYDEWMLDFSPEGKHTPYLMYRILHAKGGGGFRAVITKFGQESNLFQDVQTKSFGRGATAPFELDVVLDGKPFNVTNVGYGVSQSLPVLVEALASAHGTWLAVQQPEVHLHPRAQATLGDVFFDMAVRHHKVFLIETHSDFTIDRFRMNFRREVKEKPDSQILFFERRGKRNVVTPLRITQSGELPADQPDSYRRFFIREQINLLGI